MSWFSDNYEKAALGGAGIIAAAVGIFIITGNEEGDAIGSPKHNKDTNVLGLAALESAKNSMTVVHEIHQGDVEGRKVNLFTGVPLLAKKGDIEIPVDLLKSDPVHKDIPNTWWLKYEIDPGFDDSPDQDEDKDGFTNREEFVTGTHPKELDNHPNPITKLLTKSVKTTQYHLKPQDFGGGKFMIKLQNRREADRNKMPGAGKPIGVGDNIVFQNALMKNRFKLVRVFEVATDKNGIKQMDKRWEYEDLKPNKRGVKYIFDRKGNLAGAKNRAFGLGIMDSNVELALNALGEGDKPFKLEENTKFSLPYDQKATKKPYLLKSVDLKAKTVNVEYTDKDGKTQTHSMQF